MKIFCATMIHESNSFSPIPTSLANFRESVLYRPSAGEGRQHLGEVLADIDHLRLMRSRGHEAVVGLIANAEPSAPINLADYQVLREEILGNLQRALPVDAVFLFLHGAQMAQGIADGDCESDLIARVREIVGVRIPIAVELDLHCNVGAATVEQADAVLACLEYPHIDFEARAHLAVDILERAASGASKPYTVMRRVPMLGHFPTTREPMKSFVESLRQREKREKSAGILAISLCHGFTSGDTANTGAGVLVVADGERAYAEAVAGEVAREFWDLREMSRPLRPSPHDAVKHALAAANGPVVIADATDNPGGGAAGDSTHLLRELLAQKVENATLAMIWDPLAAQLATKAGAGNHIALRLGGKTGPASGLPLDVEATVLAVNPQATQKAQGGVFPLGMTVAVQVEGVQVVINSIRQQTFSPECFSSIGIDPRAQRILVVKSSQHFFETFSPFASEIIYADGPQDVPVDHRSYPYRKVPRPIWPRDDIPFDAFGTTWN
ncbi:MAG: M81 family metallopeptidase [Proteobacteria bacterium]|nr:M81 family metallopeptidase [Pseudomonadota bacterium]